MDSVTTPPGPEPDKNPWLGEPTAPPGGAPGYQPYGQPPPAQQPYTQQPYGQPPYTPYGAGPYAQPRGTNALAIASLVASLVWVCGIGSIAAIIMGHIARSQAKRTGEQGEGMALAGLILGYLGIGIVIAYIVVLVIAYSLDPSTFG